MQQPITVHLILNAHIDPVWIWPWQSGLDAAIATCRSACDRLDAHPDIFFTRGEAWIYDMVEKTDPALFARIRKHVESGRWEIAGGWYIQPDCNLPSGIGFERQIGLGKQYFEEKFGQFPKIGYNVDSFGHTAGLPGLMRAAGQDRYVMMRPQEHEMKLPARLFRWRGCEGGPEVTTFRIAHLYLTRWPINRAHIESALTELPEGIRHTMCFIGLGNHGGGPTEKQIAWLQENADSFPGARLVFSTLKNFFDSVQDQRANLPLVTGELQMHAIGCYTVERSVKTRVRRAEHLLGQAEVAAGYAQGQSLEDPAFRAAWEKVCFNQFHDTLGGTSLPDAYRYAEAQLGAALSFAEETLHIALRRRLTTLPPDPKQRLVVWNASDSAFDDYIETDPDIWNHDFHLIADDGRVVPHQTVARDASIGPVRVTLRMALAPNELATLRVVADKIDHASRVSVTADEIGNETGTQCAGFAPVATCRFASGVALAPRLELLDDATDTWSHGIDRYAAGPGLSAHWEAPSLIDRGPIMASLIQTGTIGDSRLKAEWRVYADRPDVTLLLTVHWLEKHRILKLTVPLPQAASSRVDGVAGGDLSRENDGKECSLRDFTSMPDLGIVCPDVYGMDADRVRLRMTLLRSPAMAHHDPTSSTFPRAVISDQGVHTFRFRFYAGAKPGDLDKAALAWQRPPVTADLTNGMPAS
ncbi:MAG: glycoside hydrolase family 38 C-terminal domain-containing protein [Capsulimonadaceae bacterium]|nr:glycoside hydrolase family 38 C-terminal domain-containing protein [Capsulimonadaceae bacterium]